MITVSKRIRLLRMASAILLSCMFICLIALFGFIVAAMKEEPEDSQADTAVSVVKKLNDAQETIRNQTARIERLRSENETLKQQLNQDQ